MNVEYGKVVGESQSAQVCGNHAVFGWLLEVAHTCRWYNPGMPMVIPKAVNMWEYRINTCGRELVFHGNPNDGECVGDTDRGFLLYVCGNPRSGKSVVDTSTWKRVYAVLKWDPR